jgi:hypothetical protein
VDPTIRAERRSRVAAGSRERYAVAVDHSTNRRPELTRTDVKRTETEKDKPQIRRPNRLKDFLDDVKKLED